MPVNWLSREVRELWLSESVEKVRGNAEFFFNRWRQSKLPIWATKSIHIEFLMCPSQEGGCIRLKPRHQFLYSMDKGNQSPDLSYKESEGRVYRVNTPTPIFLFNGQRQSKLQVWATKSIQVYFWKFFEFKVNTPAPCLTFNSSLLLILQKPGFDLDF